VTAVATGLFRIPEPFARPTLLITQWLQASATALRPTGQLSNDRADICKWPALRHLSKAWTLRV